MLIYIKITSIKYNFIHYTPTTLANIQNLEKKKIALTYFPCVKPAKCLNTGVRCNAVRF